MAGSDTRTSDERSRRMRQVFEGLDQAVLVFSHPEWTIVDCNPAAERVFGYPCEELVGMPLMRLLRSDGAMGALRREAEDVLRTNGVYRKEAVMRHRDGSDVESEQTLTLLSPKEGLSGGAVGSFRDISLRKALEERLVEAEKMEAVGRLAGGIAHDFNNLITVIRSNMDLLAGDARFPRELRDYTEEVGYATKQATYLTRQLLAFSRRQVSKPRPVVLNDVVSEMRRLVTRLVGENISFDLELDPDIAPVEVDPGQVEQIIMNLAANASEAMPSGGSLTIRTSCVHLGGGDGDRFSEMDPGAYVLLEVADTGEGMNEATRRKAFEPFFTTRERQGGTGLGLASVRGVVRQSGGSVDVRSAPGEGTSVTLCFPATDRPAEPVRAPRTAAPTRRAGATILVVEDEKAVRKVVARTLQRAGHQVLTAGSAEEAMELVQKGGARIDLLLTDLILPGATGLALVEQLQPMIPGLKVLVMSGYSGGRGSDERLRRADTPFLPKPFAPDALTDRVSEILEDG